MLYSMYEMNRMAMTPWRAAANATRRMIRAPWNPMGDTVAGRTMAAAAELFESVTRRYGKPEWMLDHTIVDGRAHLARRISGRPRASHEAHGATR